MLVLKNNMIKMFNKKGAILGGLPGLFIFGFICIGIMIIALFVIVPLMGERAKLSVDENIAKFNENLFLFNYLRHTIEEKTMADLVVKAYVENNNELLKQETMNFFNELYSQETRICCKIKAGMFSEVYYWREKEECDDVVSKANCINWQIYINDKLFINNLHTSGKEKTTHETYIPNYYNLEPIKFKFVFY